MHQKFGILNILLLFPTSNNSNMRNFDIDFAYDFGIQRRTANLNKAVISPYVALFVDHGLALAA